MKLFMTVTILAVIVWSMAAVRAQESDTSAEDAVKKNITNETNASPVTPETVTTAEPALARPPETEAEREARIQKTKFYQAQVDDCNHDFMGLPVEHEVCIQKVLDQIETDTPGGNGKAEENKKNE